MIWSLLKHSWKEFRRSPMLNMELVQTFFLGIIALYFILSMIGLAVAVQPLMEEYFPKENNLLAFVVAGLCYYAPFDLLMRYFVQKFPSMTIKPYLSLPISKSQLSHYLLLRSVGSFFNFLPVFFLVPFFLIHVMGVYPLKTIVLFLLFVNGLVFFNNYLAFGITKNMAVKSGWTGGILVAIIALLFLEYQGVISIFEPLRVFAGAVLQNPFLAVLPLLLAVGIYWWLHVFFKNQLHLDTEQQVNNLTGANWSTRGWFSRFGKVGDIMELETKLILRSKRARAYFFTSLVFIPCGLLFVDADSGLTSPYMLIIIGLLVTGAFALNHGQLMLSWNSLHFDLLMSRGNTLEDIFKAKYYILVIGCIAFYLLSLPYGFLSLEMLVFNTVMLLFNLTVSIFAYMYLACSSSRRVNPNEGSAFSFDGFGAAHFLIIIPLMIVPVVIYWLGSLIGGKALGVAAIGVVGAMGLIFHRSILKDVVHTFKRNRYKVAAAFRKK